MSERKVLSKYYPPDFDPSAYSRSRGPKPTGPKVQTVRVAAPFSMRCTSCGEYIYKGRKFNARKETPLDERYLGIQIFRFYIRCTRCSAEITYKTDPKNNDYAMERGAKRNTEPWRQKELADETDEQRLDRLEREMQEEQEEAELMERNPMADLEQKHAEAQREMEVADALDEIRTRTERREQAAKEGNDVTVPVADAASEEARRKQDEEDEVYMATARARIAEDAKKKAEPMPPPPPPSEFVSRKKRPLDVPQMPALKLLKKTAEATPAARIASAPVTAKNQPAPAPVAKKGALVDYESDSDEE